MIVKPFAGVSCVPTLPRILLVDDDVRARDLLRRYLISWGFDVRVLPGTSSLERVLQHQSPDILVLDRLMPGIDGLAVLRSLRASGNDVPVIMLTAPADENDRIVGLETGADDYLCKPFDPRELVARIQSVLRRSRASYGSATSQHRVSFKFGGFVLNCQSRTLSTVDKSLFLSDGDFALLQVFISLPMRTLTRQRLFQFLYGQDCETSARGIDAKIRRLRLILENDPSTPRHASFRPYAVRVICSYHQATCLFVHSAFVMDAPILLHPVVRH